MRLIWLVALVAAVGLPDRERDRAALLAADRAHARATDFMSAFADDATYLHPGAPLVHGKDAIRAVLAAPEAGPVTWTPAFADVSNDGTLGYTYGWTQLADQRGKYLACWRRRADGPWRIRAYARTNLGPMAAGSAATSPSGPVPRPPVRGHADSHELLAADSAFAALSVARGARAAFFAFAADDGVILGPGAAPMNHGREAIGAAFAEFPADAVLEWAPVAADIAGSGDLGCTVGEARVRARGSYSKYLTVWKRQPDGTWKFVADGGNARPAPQPTPGCCDDATPHSQGEHETQGRVTCSKMLVSPLVRLVCAAFSLPLSSFAHSFRHRLPLKGHAPSESRATSRAPCSMVPSTTSS